MPASREAHHVREAAAGRHGVLRDVRHAVVAVVEPDAVPVHGGRQVEPVGELDDDARLLIDVDQRPRVLPVEAVHDERSAAEGAADEPGLEPQRVAIAETDELPWAGFGERGRVRGREERRHVRPEPHQRLRHRDLRVHGRHDPAVRGRAGRLRVRVRRMAVRVPARAVAARRRGREDEGQVVRLHEHARRLAAQHEPAGALLDVRRRLGRDQDEELVERDAALRDTVGAKRAELHDGVQDGRRRPRDVRGVGAE